VYLILTDGIFRFLLKEWGEKESDTLSLSQRMPTGNDIRYLGYGNLFGEVSLVTESPYFTSTNAVGKC
jgi:hypothetical protein